MQRFFTATAALSGFLAVAMGAFGAHGLKQHLTGDALMTWQTAAQYQMYHALALLAVSLLLARQPTKTLKLSGLAFILGSLLFCGSLYALALGAPRWFGIITPFGGLGFLTGWLALFIAAVRR